jgi:hypothetical protein
VLRYLHRLLTEFDDALDWMEDDPLLSPFEPPVEHGDTVGWGGEAAAATAG